MTDANFVQLLMRTEAGDDLWVVDRCADRHLELFADVVQRAHVLKRHVRHRREALSVRKQMDEDL